MLAWSHLSQMTTSPLPTSAEIVPRFVWNPVEKTSAASRFRNAARRSSSSRWSVSVPFKNREPQLDVPYFLTASIAAFTTLGWVVSPR